MTVARWHLSFVVLAATCVHAAFAQTASQKPPSDDAAVAVAHEAQIAIAGGAAVSDITLSANATWIVGSTTSTGTATLRARGLGEARIDISAGAVRRSEIRNDASPSAGEWIGSDGKVHRIALHNAQMPPAWFSPAFVVAALSSPDAVLKYVGSATKNGLTLVHIQLSQWGNYRKLRDAQLFARLSQVDIYLDPKSHLPLVISWNGHPDGDYRQDIPIEIRYGAYGPVGGIYMPARIQRLVNGNLNLDLQITSASVNSGLSDTPFGLQ